MKIRLSILGLLLLLSIQAMSQQVKALVGGTLIDGFGGTPIRHSVIIVEGEGIMVVVEVKKLSWVAQGATHDSYWFDDFYSMMICSLVSSPSTTTWIK